MTAILTASCFILKRCSVLLLNNMCFFWSYLRRHMWKQHPFDFLILIFFFILLLKLSFVDTWSWVESADCATIWQQWDVIGHLRWSHTQSPKVFSFRFFIFEDKTIPFPIIFNLPITFEIFALEFFPFVLFFSCPACLSSSLTCHPSFFHVAAKTA